MPGQTEVWPPPMNVSQQLNTVVFTKTLRRLNLLASQESLDSQELHQLFRVLSYRSHRLRPQLGQHLPF